MKEFLTDNKVRMHDTDMAGILYFGSQFRFVHDAWEDMIAEMGFSFERLFGKENFLFVIVHAESDYLRPLQAGDSLKIVAVIEEIKNTSFIVNYKIFRDKDLVGTAKTIHVTIDKLTRKKIPIPPHFRSKLQMYTKSEKF